MPLRLFDNTFFPSPPLLLANIESNSPPYVERILNQLSLCSSSKIFLNFLIHKLPSIQNYLTFDKVKLNMLTKSSTSFS